MTSARVVRLYLVADRAGGLHSAPNLSASATAATTARTEATVPPPFENLEAHAGAVYRYALRLTGRADAAEDLAQETLLRAWRQRDAIRDERAARLWLLRVVQNLWTDQLRRKKFRPQALEHEPNCPRPSSAAGVDEREAVALALAAMDELPPRQRQVLYLSTCEELTHAEVAEVLDLPASAVKASLSLARKAMRRRLKEVYEQACGGREAD